jgi:hypothetical protein
MARLSVNAASPSRGFDVANRLYVNPLFGLT